MTCLPYLVCP
jgi:hypothetical protein